MSEPVVGHRWVRRRPRPLWWAAAAAVPMVLAGLALITTQGDVQDDLGRRTQQALAARGMDGVQVSFDGRDATVAVPAGTSQAAAEAVVRSVSGVRSVSVLVAASTADPAAAPTSTGPECTDVQAQIDRILGSDRVHFEYARTRPLGDEEQQVEAVAALVSGCRTTVDVIGNNPSNVRPDNPISLARAQSVADTLRRGGATVDRVAGVHDDQPVAGNASQDGRALNRYVAIRVH